jgi:hypothetical protein
MWLSLVGPQLRAALGYDVSSLAFSCRGSPCQTFDTAIDGRKAKLVLEPHAEAAKGYRLKGGIVAKEQVSFTGLTGQGVLLVNGECLSPDDCTTLRRAVESIRFSAQ